MGSLTEEGSIQSSESLITSLLASHNLQSSTNDVSIWFKDKQYNSATKALEAYIEDFDQSLKSPDVSTGKLCVKTSSVKYDRFSKSLDKHKEGSKDEFSLRELEGLSQPLRRRIASDPDLVSLTTDDLLVLPPDGSLPITHASALKSTSQSDHRRPYNHSRKKTTRSFKQPRYFTDSSTLAYGKNSHFHSGDSFVALDKKCVTTSSQKDFSMEYPGTKLPRHEQNAYVFTPSSSPFTVKQCKLKEHDLKLSHSKNYPRWITSQKSDLDVSGITSIPDLKYPGWLKDYELLSDSDTHSSTQSQNKEKDVSSHFRIIPKNVTWLEDVDTLIHSPSHDDLFGSTDETEILLGSMKHVVDEDKCLDIEGTFSQMKCVPGPKANVLHKDLMNTNFKEPFKDDQIELLILKAERALESPGVGLTHIMQNDGSPRTEDVLEAERSWENIPVTFKSPVPVFTAEDDQLKVKSNLIDDFLQDCMKTDCRKSTLSGGNHPGPVEALKQMLFNLQTVQQNLRDEQAEEPYKAVEKLSEDVSEIQLNYETEPGSRSLERALHHLARLKELVDDSSIKKDPETEVWKHKEEKKD